VKIRVLVVDDSAFARKVVREVLQHAGDIEVLDIARDGLEALEKNAALKPDVMTLDLVMPGLDGLGVLRSLPAIGGPRVVVVSSSSAETELGLAALEAGAVDVVHKPTSLATDRLYELAEPLVAAVRVAALAKKAPRIVPVAPPPPVSRPAARRSSVELLVIGTSTGGPQALTSLIAALPRSLPVPVAVVVHMPAGYTEALARRLDTVSELTVIEAHDGLILSPGLVAIARAGTHLHIARTELGIEARFGYHKKPGELHQPSVNALFETAASALGPAVLGVILTGMGDDGVDGARAILQRGGRVLGEAESSCVVYGMPRAAREAEVIDAELPLESMARAIVDRLY
jgi:two-component system, chemotaxis family, protein-glutamate methylesterase/glutaminase